jgi:hypothetical protein
VSPHPAEVYFVRDISVDIMSYLSKQLSSYANIIY